jgi:hypothetical protein
LVDNFKDYVMQYLVDNFMRKIGVPLRIIAAVDVVMNLSAVTIIQAILRRYGLAYLAKWVFWLSLL